MKRKMVKATALTMAMLMLAGCGIGASDDSSKADKEEKKLEEIPLVDESFEGCTEREVSFDLIRWLLATNAVEVQGQGLDWDTIGGTDLSSDNITAVKSFLKDKSVKDSDTAIEKVEELVNEEYEEDYERAYNLGTAEAILAASYCSSQMEFDEYLMHAVPVAKMIQQEFESFDDYGDNYVKGYMYQVGRGEYGDASTINERVMAQQEFVGQARFYDGAYAIDYDMELTTECYSTFFDDMPETVDKDALKDKTPEFVEGYIEPVELGDNPACGNIEIDGDVYHMPCTVTQFINNGWEVKEGPSELGSSDEELTLKRGRKSITVEAKAISEDYPEVEYGLIEVADSIFMGSVDVVLAGDIKPGMDFEEAAKPIKKYNLENESSGDGFTAFLSDDSYNNSKLMLSNTNSKIGSIILYVTLVGGERNLESYYDLLEEDEDMYNYSHAMSIRAKTFKFRPEAANAAVESDVELSDSLDDFTFQIDGTTFKLPVTYQQLVDVGFDFEDAPETMVPAGESYEFSGYYLGNEYSKMNFAVVNNEDKDVALGDIPVQYVRATMFGFNQYKDYPFVIAQGAEIETYKLDDLEEMYGPLTKSDESFDNGYVQLDYYNYKTEKGWYSFWIQPEGTLSGIEMNVYTNRDTDEESSEESTEETTEEN